MKHIFLLLSIFYFSANAQEYKFNYLAQYTFHNTDAMHYANFEDDSYFLSIFKDSDNTIHAKLFDARRLKIHFLKVAVDNSNGISFSFKYEKSNNFKIDRNRFQNHDYRLTKFESANKDFDSLRVDIFKNSKSKRSLTHLNLQLKKSNDNLFNVFRNFVHPFEFEPAFTIPGKYTVTKATEINLTGSKKQYSLKEMKEVDFKITVPN